MRAIAVIPKAKQVSLIDQPEPEISSPSDVKLRMIEAGVCGTDKEICAFEYGTPPVDTEYLVIGHESLGEVVEVGPEVSRVKVGDLVVPMVRRPCPHIDCVACITAIAIIYSPWGKQSGAHINPSTTITFFRLGKINICDAAFYLAFQFVGGLLGALAATTMLSTWASHPSVNYVVTVPGYAGAIAAFVAEVAIAFILMTVILHVSNDSRLHKLTGVCTGALVMIYITFEAPISGMSMNPARSFASAVVAWHWADLWIYFTAPLIGMLSAGEAYLHIRGARHVGCAKLHHENSKRCIFCGKPAT